MQVEKIVKLMIHALLCKVCIRSLILIVRRIITALLHYHYARSILMQTETMYEVKCNQNAQTQIFKFELKMKKSMKWLINHAEAKNVGRAWMAFRVLL